MTRSINPVPQYTQGSKPLANGKVYFFETGTNIPKSTYADSAETIANTHPVILDAEGRLPNVFFSGVAKQILLDENDVQIFNRDPVGQEIAFSAFDTFALTLSYQLHSIVTASDGTFWKSLVANNIGFNPLTDDGTHWQRVDFNEFYAAGVTYSKNDSVTSLVNGLTYISGINSNIGNEPSANLDKWALDRPALPYVSGKTYDIGEKCIDELDNREYAAILSNTGNQPSTSPANWLPTDGLVTKPVNSAPADSATGISRMPTLTTDAYAITGSSADFEWAQYQLSKDSFATIHYDSGIVRDTPSHVVTSQLDAATVYSYRAYHKGIRTDISEASTTTTFTTTLNLSESFDNVTFTGTGAALNVSCSPDLSTNDGAVFVVNTSTTDNFRIVDTVRAAGNAFIIPSIIETAEATGLTAFNLNSFTVGAAAAYNASGDSIWSLVLKKTAKFFDMVNGETGTGAARNVSHSLNDEVGFIICCQETGAAPAISANFTWIRGMSANDALYFGANNPATTASTIWNGTLPTTAVFSLGTDDAVNGTSRDYTFYLGAHNPSAGIYCDTITVAGTATDKITTGFPAGVAFIKKDATLDWVIVDKNLGTSSQIDFDSNAQLAAGTNISSFDSDGITLANLSAGDWSVIIIADPDLF